MRCVLKVLEALVPELPKSSIRHPLPRYTRGVSTSESELESPTKPEPGIKFESLLQRVDENSSAVQNEASSAESCGSLPVEGSSGNYNENNNKDSQGSNGEDREEDEEEEEEEESRQNGRLLLYETIQGCLYNFLSKWKSEENSEQVWNDDFLDFSIHLEIQCSTQEFYPEYFNLPTSTYNSSGWRFEGCKRIREFQKILYGHFYWETKR